MGRTLRQARSRAAEVVDIATSTHAGEASRLDGTTEASSNEGVQEDKADIASRGGRSENNGAEVDAEAEIGEARGQLVGGR